MEAAADAAGSPGSTTRTHRTVEPRWAWDARFLGTLVARLRKEVVGVTPDGLRIDWHVTDGSFVGPELDAVVLPGAADWMRIRPDGIGIVNVQACFETRINLRELVNAAMDSRDRGKLSISFSTTPPWSAMLMLTTSARRSRL